MSKDRSVSSFAVKALLVAALLAVSIYGFLTYLDPVFVYTYATFMRLCG
ncbi:hypothetical protein H1W37_17235 [Stappia taiwanensis]|uniref:Uncharacterized protein n=1 Tax=Stappia taiwanensis TaxID=992267 RepID=A0A838XUL2_9HYPH|nr:hypothetical protein [Stappia taiwanensis]MBA4613407.1 hypothetical protein [Stappia taiwanensis]GGE82337.1 hypothetical protein GCM10007285_07400 [Stappia taiwanensis]